MLKFPPRPILRAPNKRLVHYIAVALRRIRRRIEHLGVKLTVKGAVAAIREGGVLNGLAHITGGGITENLPRMLPGGCGAEVSLSAWSLPPVFQWLQGQGGIEEGELLKTFNCGIRMIAAVPEDRVEVATSAFEDDGHDVTVIGRVTEGDGVVYRGQLS